ncbi:MG2 domain-containing protein [Dyadobacter sp. SG02]|uniref:carboxypeptidase-like regulatory domain-containing protein n=1 Tax=Dyadobacter sp. SG02 TaxID=1855291 RepID=UPI0008AAB94D|nr:carboxypeptidase-like regulatory domain-containing protein [Dyadobacter sp. SG02]SEJ66905.1 MG2 domain-containing protein [Dyadobacter sp. SG02]
MRCSFFVALITVLLLTSTSLLSYGQKTATLTGQVTDAATGKAMPFANVYVNGTTNGAVTDEKGAYTLTGISPGTVEIAVSFVGYLSVSQKIRFDDASAQKANFQLQPNVQMLDAVTVRGNPKSWERHLRQFKKQLFGEPFGGQCELVNSEVLNFNEVKGHLYATADAPLIIDNQALGYRLIYALQHFDATGAKVYSAGTARFEELKPENERQAERFRRNRLAAYKGSTRHLLASMVNNTFEQAGFLVYQEDATKSVPLERRLITLSAAISEYKRLVPVKASALIQPGRLATERRLVSPRKLVVFYTKATSTFSPYPDARYAYTEIRLPSGQMQMTADGVVTIPEGMETQGSMGDDRLSTMLPVDWKPEGNEKEELLNDPLATQGKLAPPDSYTESISTAFNERFKFLSPTLFLHIDKAVYATGDRLWMSTYLLDAVTHERIGGETVMQVDLLTPAGKVVQHQWVKVGDGRGQGNFRLSDTLSTGMYRLRAYTDEDDTNRRPAFERSVAIYNLFRGDLSVESDSSSNPLDIRIFPEGGRWIAGLPARLGVKIVQPNSHGLLLEGRIVDDLGAEIVRFKTNPQGMTSISMQPNATRTYYADVVYKNQLQHIPLPKPETEGLTLSSDVLSDTTRLALTITSSSRTATDSVYILIQQRGRIVDQRKIFLQNGTAKISLPVTSWSPGIAQITLYDATARPQAERLVFIPEFKAPVRVALGLNKSRYQPREQVIMSVNLENNGSPASAALSASITDAGKVPGDTIEANLQTHLLLTGELRGQVENPNYYVTKQTAETRRALDDLLMTQGWRRVSGMPGAELASGLSFNGRILNAKNQPIPGAQITVASTAAGQSFVKSASADQQGRFRLPGLAVTDTVQLMVQIADAKSRHISPSEVFVIRESPSKLWETGKIPATRSWSVLRPQLEAAKSRQEANADLYRDKTAKQLNEVTVKARKPDERPEDVQMRSLHDQADAVAVFDEKSPLYANLYEMVRGRFAGVTVSQTSGTPKTPPGYMVNVRGASSFKSGTQPLFLLDGVAIQDPDGVALLAFNARDIERIELLKNAGTVGIYGVLGGNGVIAFFSKSARSMQGNTTPQSRTKPVQFIGFPSVQREFYVPRYDLEASSGSAPLPVDDRDVLYWKPLMQTDSKGHSQLRFPLSDKVRTLRVEIQGVTADGRPVYGTELIQVQ